MTVTFVLLYIVRGCVKYIASVFSESLNINKTEKLRRGLSFTQTLMAFFVVLYYDILCTPWEKRLDIIRSVWMLFQELLQTP